MTEPCPVPRIVSCQGCCDRSAWALTWPWFFTLSSLFISCLFSLYGGLGLFLFLWVVPGSSPFGVSQWQQEEAFSILVPSSPLHTGDCGLRWTSVSWAPASFQACCLEFLPFPIFENLTPVCRISREDWSTGSQLGSSPWGLCSALTQKNVHGRFTTLWSQVSGREGKQLAGSSYMVALAWILPVTSTFAKGNPALTVSTVGLSRGRSW